MANASLNIPITGDASAFLAEISRASSELKKFQDEFNNAFTTKGKKVKLDVEVANIEGSIADLQEKLKGLKETRGNISPFDVNALKAVNIEIKTTQDEIKRLQSLGVKQLEILPPPGSIAALKKELADLTAKRNLIEPFRIEHLTDVVNRITRIKDEIKRIESIGVAVKVDPISPVLENSIAGLQEKLSKLRNTQINIDVVNQEEIARTNDEIIKLETEIQRLKGLSIDPSGKLVQSSAKARQAITSLSLVAQDLPFGFIAIQNNLPAVLQTFTELETKNKGLKGAFKELGSALVGPAGAFLAFSVVTSIVTSLVKEYGSLSNAIKVLTSTNQFLAKAQIDFSNETAKASGQLVIEDSKIKALTKSLLDSGTPREEQIALYEELKRISPDIVSGVDKENLGTAEANKLISQNVLLRAESVKLQIQEAGIKAVASKNAEALALANQKEAEAVKRLAKAQSDFDVFSRQTQQPGSQAIQSYAQSITDAKDDIASVRKEISQLNIVQEQFLGQLDPITLRIAQINGVYKSQSDALEELRKKQQEALKTNNKTFTPTIDAQDLDEAFNLDKIISNINKYGNALIDVENSEKERKNALKELIEINPEYFAGFDLNKKRVEELRGKLEDFIRTLLVEKKAREDSSAASKINTEFRKREEKGIESLGDKYNYFADSVNSIPTDIDTAIKLSEQFDEIGNSTQKATKANNEFINSLKFGQEVIEILQKGLNLKETYNNAIEDLLNFSEYANKEIEKIAKNLRFLQEPLEGLFTTLLEDGKVSWKTFADDVIKQIKRIAAALLSKAIIQGIASLLAPGSGQIVGAGLKGISNEGLGSFLDGNDWIDLFPTGDKKGQANFGRIRGNQGVSMSGQVNMVLRGNDLVGAMNRTNSTISRVG